MEKLETLDEFKRLISGIGDVEEVKRKVDEVLDSGVNPLDVVNALSEALEEVGRKYENREYFLSDLIMAGVLATEVTKTLEPYLVKTERKSLGKVVVGTVKGDIHDIGKNIVIMMLYANGFEVLDLGVDVPAEKFAEVVKKENPQVLGLSALLTSTIHEMRNVIETLKKKGVRDRVKVIVGGRPVTREFAEEIGADGYGRDAVEAVKEVKRLLGMEA
ncbi:corrinoid protein [Candidatus Bathyarchaeota archaeon]|nr:corrinoid protein [Candidatus Bathyarchaeota archaeon]